MILVSVFNIRTNSKSIIIEHRATTESKIHINEVSAEWHSCGARFEVVKRAPSATQFTTNSDRRRMSLFPLLWPSVWC